MPGNLDSHVQNDNNLPTRLLVESLLFAAGEPVRVDLLAKTIEVSQQDVETALQDVERQYEESGLRLQRRANRVQIVTAPQAAGHVRRLLGLEAGGPLSPAALEALAIVAYLQPVTRAQVEAIRGVNSDSVLRTLVTRGLIEECGRLEQPGRPIMYGTSFEFLQQFGLSSTAQLPPLAETQTNL